MNWSQIIFVALASIGLAACSEVGFETRRAEFLNKTSVMSGSHSDSNIDAAAESIRQVTENEGDGASGNVSQRHESAINPDGTSGDITQPPYLGSPGQQEAMVTRNCTDRGWSDATTFKAAAAARDATMSVTINNKSCTTVISTIVGLAKQTSISIADLKSLCPASIPSRGQLIVNFNWPGMPDEDNDNSQSIDLLWARNKNSSGLPIEAADEHCTNRYSPLVIHVGKNRDNPAPISLTSIAEGVAFDLLGARNGHKKVQIGWFTNHDYAFLTLPDEDGQVHGIDQLFGDNTQGPDGSFSADGYAALAKYDGTSSDGRSQLAASDGRIDRQDPVFSRLRLWTDRNLDGVAESSELVPLDRANIVFIDLNYSSDYVETDKHGNQTRMKSVVGLADGSLDMIFDLWFVYRTLNGQ